MKKHASFKNLIVVSLGLAMIGSALQSNAVSIPIGNLLGTIVPGTPSSEAAQGEMIRFLADAYNTSPTPRGLGDNPADGGSAEVYTLRPGVGAGNNLPAALSETIVPSIPQVVTSDPNIVLATGWDYLLAKFGNDSEVFYINGLTGSLTIPNFTGNANGLSHYMLANRSIGVPPLEVPDGGSTLALIGIAALATGIFRRSIKK